jgi:type IV pilus assembly protein PilO
MALDLNDKPWYVALIVGLVLGGALYTAVHFYVFEDIRADISRRQDSIAKLEREIEKGRAAQRDLPKLEEEIRNDEVELDRLKQILPTRRETDRLIKKVRQLTEAGHFTLVRFTPQPFVEQDFYYEWPIAVNLQGTYHELGLLFDRLSRFSRIINVTELTILPSRVKGSDTSISATFTARTFIYKDESSGTAKASGGTR